ncbi:MAG TPA: PEGA domain-containing protein, partial [Polyangiaceae bacterium]
LRSYLDAAAASDGARIAEVQKLISRNEKRIGTFSIRAEPAEAAVEIDGERVTPSGEGQVSVAVGKHIVLATHDGYEPLLLPIEVRGGETLTLHLSLSTLRPMLVPVPVDTLVSVRILPSDPSARVFVDGSPFDGQVLPAGRHRVEVMGQGYAPWARDVEVSAGRTNVVLVPLEPLPPRESAARADRKAWALVTGVSGILCAGIVTALQIYNNGRYREWSSDRDQLSQEITAGSAGPDRAARARDLQQRAAQIQRTDDVSVLFGGASVALLGTSTVLYFGK